MELGEQVVLGERPAARAAAPSTSAGFVAGFTTRGPIDAPDYAVSIADFEDKFGGRLSGDPEVYDCVDAAFHEGASAIYMARVVGSGAKAATKDFPDAAEAPKTSLTITAKDVGEYGNSLKIKITNTAEKIVITVLEGSTILEASPSLESQDAAVAWGEETSDWVDATKGASSKVPKTQELTLAGGEAKTSSANGASLTTALDLFAKDLGPGQVSVPNFREEEGHLAAIAHCVANNRRALHDDESEATASELIENATALSSAPGKGARYAAYFASWAVIPGLTSGTTRTCPWSGVQMGIIARSESEGNNPNKPAAGRKRGKARWALGLVSTFTTEEQSELDDAGVTYQILADGVPCNFGDRTLIDTDSESKDWRSFAASRLVMAASEKTRIVLQGYEFEQIDGHGHIFGDLAGEISGRALMPYFKEDALYGELPSEAFAVNTGPAVNTPASIEAEELKAQIAIRISPKAGMLRAEVVNVPISEAV